MPDPIPLRGTSLHDGVAARLRALVFDGQLLPGAWIDEKALAEQWQVSRTPLREALKVLAAEGLVELVPQRGCRVIELSEQDADALFPVMALLEGRCAHEAAAKAGPEDLRTLRRLHDELEHHAAQADLAGYYRANHAFHTTVQQLAHNRWLDRATGDLRKFLRLMRGRQLALPGRIAASLNEHRVLIDAFEQRDAARAERAMHDHLMAQLVALKKLRQTEQAAAAATTGSPPPMLDELREAAARQRLGKVHGLLRLGSKRLLSERGEMNGMAVARELIDRLDTLDDAQLDDYFDHLAQDLSPDPATVLRCAQAYAEAPTAQHLIALTHAAEPPRQELLRRLNRTPGGTQAVLRLRRALLARLKHKPELLALEDDLLHLLSSWFNPGFLRMQRVDWNSPAQLLEKLILHEAVHTIDGWDDLRRRLQPDRRCFAFFHPQLPGEPLIFVEVALLPEMPAHIAPLIDKVSTPLPPDRFKVAAFYSISNCEPGLRGVSLGNFLIKQVAQQLQSELPSLKTFCTLSPIPGLAAWLEGQPDFSTLPGLGRAAVERLDTARQTLLARAGGEWAGLHAASQHEQLGEAGEAALLALGAAWLGHASPLPGGDPVARFHLDNGARLERLNLRGNMSPKGLRQSFGLMVNYQYDLDRIEPSLAKFRSGQVARSRSVAGLI